jgi:hypothetical protein
LQQDAPLTANKETLLREVELTAAATPARRVESIYWGGGAPGILGPARFFRKTPNGQAITSRGRVTLNIRSNSIPAC